MQHYEGRSADQRYKNELLDLLRDIDKSLKTLIKQTKLEAQEETTITIQEEKPKRKTRKKKGGE